MNIINVRPDEEISASVGIVLVPGNSRVRAESAGGSVTTLHIGIGKDAWTPEKLVRRVVRAAIDQGLSAIRLDFKEIGHFHGLPEDAHAIAKAVGRAVTMASYSFDEHLTEKDSSLETVIVVSDEDIQDSLAVGVIIGECINNARTLSNQPANVVTPGSLAQHAYDISRQYENVHYVRLDKRELQNEDLELILAVGKGSDHLPSLIQLSYEGNPGNTDYSVVIGKGVCYDTGGYSMKSPDNMLGMHLDMSGAASALEIVHALARLKAPVNVVALVPAVENSVSGKAYRPGDIIQTAAGISVEVTNTDAEGRLVLADALWFAKRFNPKVVFDLATLTGAAHIALGDAFSGIFTTDDNLAADLIELGENCCDPVWCLPIGPRYAQYLKSGRADIANACTSGKHGGASSAAWFLYRFAEAAGFADRYVHIDIAPRMEQALDDEHLARGAMGAGIALLVDHFTTQ